MRLLPRPVYERGLDTAAPFSRDNLGREALARNLTRLFKVSSDGLVVALDGKWGEGKTSFIRFWDALLSQDQEFISIYYDAFRHDFTGDAFVSIAAAIYKGLEKQLKGQSAKNETRAQLDHLKKATKDVAINLAKMTTGLGVSFLTGGLVNNEAVADFTKQAAEKLTFGTLEAKADEQFEAYLGSQDTIRSYQDKLRELLSPEGVRGQHKIVLLIDELDRCRPTFAVEILEKVKHFFNIPGVFFVLSINKPQLLRTIERVYGLGEDSTIYLQKFVDFEARLSPTTDDTSSSTSNVIRNFNGVAEELKLIEDPVDIRSELTNFVQLAADLFKLNARAMEKSMTLMALGLRSCSDHDATRLKQYIVIAAIIRIGAPDSYERLRAHGTFGDSHNDTRQRQLFEWAKERFKNERSDQASNVFAVAGMKEACRLLDLYELPGPAPIPERKNLNEGSLENE